MYKLMVGQKVLKIPIQLRNIILQTNNEVFSYRNSNNNFALPLVAMQFLLFGPQW